MGPMTSSPLDGDRDPAETLRTGYDWSAITPSMAVIEVVSDVSGKNPTDLEPLYFSVDPGALDRLVQGNGVNADIQKLSVSFTFTGYAITVWSHGIVELGRNQ